MTARHLSLGLLAAALALAPIAAQSGEKRPDLTQAAKQVVEQTNTFRKKEGRQAIAHNPKLAETAQYFADFMAETGKYSHDADGTQPGDRAKKFGYDYCLIAENIAYQFSGEGFETKELAGNFLEGWKNSPGHRKNMLDPDMTETGVALARSKETGRYYAVQMFGRAKTQSIKFQVTSEAKVEIEYKLDEQPFPLPPRVTRTHEHCRPPELVFHLPDGDKTRTKTLRVASGDKLVVFEGKDGVDVKKEH